MAFVFRSALFSIAISGALLGQSPAKTDWIPVFSDEFNANDLDLTKWAPHSAVSSARSAVVPGAIELSTGHARIVAKRHDGNYTSGAMSTYGTFAQMYGRFEIRLKAPEGRGLESRCRLLPVPSGELPSIDVMRVLGTAPDRALFGNQWGDVKTERGYAGDWKLSATPDGFHIIAVEWDESKIVWFLDGKERFRSSDGIPRQPLYLELDLNVAGGEAKYPDATTPLPAALEIDYVRAFKRPK